MWRREPRVFIAQGNQLDGRSRIDFAGRLDDMIEFLLVHQSRATAAKIC